MELTVKQAKAIAIGLSEPSKMPCSGYSIPTAYCHTGSILRDVKGSVCEGCYAHLRGNYRFKNVQSALEKRYQSLNDPQWVDAMVTLIRETNQGDTRFFRWHDSGDIQGESHLEKICEIARRMPDVTFWLPTKEWKLTRDYFAVHPMPSNLTVRLSMPRKNQGAPDAEPDEQFVYSEVFTKDAEPSNAAWVCPSMHQERKCLDCRKCWDKSNRVTAYPEH